MTSPNHYVWASGSEEDIRFNLTTRYGGAWENFLNETLSKELNASDFSITVTPVPGESNLSIVDLLVTDVGELEIRIAVIEAKLI